MKRDVRFALAGPVACWSQCHSEKHVTIEVVSSQRLSVVESARLRAEPEQHETKSILGYTNN